MFLFFPTGITFFSTIFRFASILFISISLNVRVCVCGIMRSSVLPVVEQEVAKIGGNKFMSKSHVNK